MFKLPDTEQEVFDIVSRHLITQNKKSDGGGFCAYRNPDGLKCAAGALIPDEHYNSSLEGCSWYELVAKNKVPSDHSVIIDELQMIHDGTEPTEWEQELRTLAETFNLNTTVLDELCTTSSC